VIASGQQETRHGHARRTMQHGSTTEGMPTDEKSDRLSLWGWIRDQRFPAVLSSYERIWLRHGTTNAVTDMTLASGPVVAEKGTLNQVSLTPRIGAFP
jgi:hypothetical protein